jgi:hypothetical protein
VLTIRSRSARYWARLTTVEQSTPSSRAIAVMLFVGSAHSSTSRHICSAGHFRSPLDIRASHKNALQRGRSQKQLHRHRLGGNRRTHGIPIMSPFRLPPSRRSCSIPIVRISRSYGEDCGDCSSRWSLGVDSTSAHWDGSGRLDANVGLTGSSRLKAPAKHAQHGGLGRVQHDLSSRHAPPAWFPTPARRRPPWLPRLAQVQPYPDRPTSRGWPDRAPRQEPGAKRLTNPMTTRQTPNGIRIDRQPDRCAASA